MKLTKNSAFLMFPGIASRAMVEQSVHCGIHTHLAVCHLVELQREREREKSACVGMCEIEICNKPGFAI